MSHAVLDDEHEERQPFDRDKLVKYLQQCGGREVLTYDDPNAALIAARAIRALEIPNLEIDASYSTIRLKLRKKQNDDT